MLRLDERIARLLINIQQRTFATTSFPRILHNAKFGEEDWANYPATLVFNEQHLNLTFTIPQQSVKTLLDKVNGDLWGAGLTATTENGEELNSSITYYSTYTTDFGGTNEGTRLTLEASKWQLLTRPAFVWVGQLSSQLSHIQGNLVLSLANQSVSSGHYALKGATNQYYVLKQKNTSLLVIEVKNEELDYDQIDDDLRILSFCLGFPISCKWLIGLDVEGKTVGYAGTNFGFYRSLVNAKKPPIPLNKGSQWLPELFERMSRKLNDVAVKDAKANFLKEVVWLYVESTAETWNTSRELKLFYACLYAASCILYWDRNLDTYISRPDADQKKKFDERKERLFSERGLFLTIEIIQFAIKRANPEDAPELIRSLRLSYSALIDSAREDLKESQNRQDHLITLCMELVAFYVDYSGPINGWSASKPIANSLAEAVEKSDNIYVAFTESPISEEDITDLWPVFKEPIIEEYTLVGLVANFAKSLASRTENRVKARLIPLPSFREKQPKLYDFVVESAQYPLAKNILFTVQQVSDSSVLEIINWEEEVTAVGNEQQLIPFLRKVASSQRTKELIERLLLVSYND